MSFCKVLRSIATEVITDNWTIGVTLDTVVDSLGGPSKKRGVSGCLKDTELGSAFL